VSYTVDTTLEPFHTSQGAPVVLRATGLTKIYPSVTGKSGADVVLFRDLNLTIRAGEIVSIVGESGTGKSTLLHLLAALDHPTAGSIVCGDSEVTRFTSAQAATYRNRDVGYIWQFHYLLPEFTAQENVAMPLLARGMGRTAALDRAAGWLEKVGLGSRLENRSGELSGGEQQRVSLARALVTEPRLLLADEPTGDLDNRTAETVFALIEQLHRDHGLTSLLVTHNPAFANRCDRTLRLRNGSLEEGSA
jgi:lipoprotein-releasing system ATP-binding protein